MAGEEQAVWRIRVGAETCLATLYVSGRPAFPEEQQDFDYKLRGDEGEDSSRPVSCGAATLTTLAESHSQQNEHTVFLIRKDNASPWLRRIYIPSLPTQWAVLNALKSHRGAKGKRIWIPTHIHRLQENRISLRGRFLCLFRLRQAISACYQQSVRRELREYTFPKLFAFSFCCCFAHVS